MVITVIISLIVLVIAALLLLGADGIAEVWRYCLTWRVRAKERELAEIQARLRNAYLSCAANLNDSAHEARVAMIDEAFRLSQEAQQQANSARQ